MAPEVKKVYESDTNGRRYHVPIKSIYTNRKQYPQKVKTENGVSFNINKPCKIDQFRKVSKYTQIEYITKLRSEYNVTDGNLAKMLGISRSTVSHILDDLNLDHQPRGCKMTDIQLSGWNHFLTLTEFAETNDRVDDASLSENVSTSIRTITNFSIGVKGKLDIYEIIQYIESLDLNGKDVDMTISIQVSQ